MGKSIREWIEQYRCMDWAVLYLRLFAGAIMMFHNIGKIQSYNEIIESYPSLPHISPAASFVFVAVAEVLLAVALIVGFRSRIAAIVLTLGILFRIVRSGFGDGEQVFVWLGIYLFFAISGGGYFSFDEVLPPKKRADAA